MPAGDAMATKAKKPNVKAQVREMLDSLPDNCTVEDVQYQLYVIEKINRSEESLRRDGGIPHEEVKRRVASWLKK
jgi:hypothetical protein